MKTPNFFNSNNNMSNFCKGSCGFYGSDKLQGYCTSCYKLSVKREQVSDIKTSTTKTIQSELHILKQSIRCSTCRKKIGIYGFSCNCDGYYCTAHRYPESHQCTHDY